MVRFFTPMGASCLVGGTLCVQSSPPIVNQQQTFIQQRANEDAGSCITDNLSQWRARRKQKDENILSTCNTDVCVTSALETGAWVIFLWWSWGLFEWRLGVWVGMSRESYSSMQGSKISKPESWRGWVQREVFRGGGKLAFVSGPPPGSLEKITEQVDSSRLPGSGLWLVEAGGQMLELQQGVRTSPAPRSHTAGTAPLGQKGPAGSQHTAQRLSDSQRRTHILVLLRLPHIKAEHHRFAPNRVRFWNVLCLLTDRVWIHFGGLWKD